MSACAGSSTERTRRFTSCVPPGTVRSARVRFFKHFAGQVPMDRAPGRIRVHEHAETGKPLAAARSCRRSYRWRFSGQIPDHPVPLLATGLRRRQRWNGPAGFSAWLATKSLLSDYRIVQLSLSLCLYSCSASPACTASPASLHHCSPLFGFSFGVETSTSATYGSSMPHIPSPSGLARLHPTLPRVPAGRRRWAERYDGKGNLYLQHAA